MKMYRLVCLVFVVIAAVGCESTGPLPDRLTFVRLTAGNQFTCGLTGDGTAYCWGRNDDGQLGDGTTITRSSPGKVETSLRFAAITAGNNHVCALTDNGAAYCWGSNDFQKLGSSPATGTPLLTPTAVKGNLRFVSIGAAFNNTCATTAQREVYCWGQIPETNQFGDFISKSTADAQRIPGSMVAVVSGQLDYCSIDAAGLAYCWDLRYFFPPSGPVVPPIGQAISTTVHFASVRRGAQHACGLESGGQAWCWGRNLYGAIGNGSITDASVPTQVSTNLTFQSIAAGSHFTCGVAIGGKLYCWGAANMIGQVPNGTVTNATTPKAVSTNVLFTSVVTGVDHSCALGADGSTYCWGSNVPTPVLVEGT